MSFTSEVRAELALEPCSDKCCARAELAAALLVSGGIAVRFGAVFDFALTITSSEAKVIRHYFLLLKRHFGITSEILKLTSNSLSKTARFRLAIPETESKRVLDEIGLTDPNALFGVGAVPKDEIVSSDSCKRAFVKSAFMTGGSIVNPAVSYHAEISAPSEEFAEFVIKNIRNYEICAKTTCRNAKYVVYLKSSGAICDLLSVMGASQAVLTIRGIQIKKEISSSAIRQYNCDQANISRVSETAVHQIEDIRLIDRELGLDKLPEKLRELAELRMERNSASLTELGEALKKPLGKSGVSARMDKIAQIAEKLRKGETVEFQKRG